MSFICNAIIKSAELNDGDRGLLTGWLHLEYGSGGQGFVVHADNGTRGER